MNGELPKASVIVPTRDRPRRLARCVAAIAALDYPHERIELVIGNDGPDALDPHSSVLAHIDSKVVSVGGRGPAAARNAAAAAASGELLAFTDDDCEPEPGWLAALAARIGGGSRRVAGGRTVNALEDNPFSTASQAITDAVYEHYNPDPDRAGFFASNNLALPAAAFSELGGFDERFALAAGEDRDFCERWVERGGELLFEPRAVVRHSHEMTAVGFVRQHYGYGRGTYRQRRLRADRGGGFELAPSATSGILSAAARRAVAERKPARLALLGAWQLANAAGFAREAISERRG